MLSLVFTYAFLREGWNGGGSEGGGMRFFFFFLFWKGVLVGTVMVVARRGLSPLSHFSILWERRVEIEPLNGAWCVDWRGRCSCVCVRVCMCVWIGRHISHRPLFFPDFPANAVDTRSGFVLSCKSKLSSQNVRITHRSGAFTNALVNLDWQFSLRVHYVNCYCSFLENSQSNKFLPKRKQGKKYRAENWIPYAYLK